MVMMPFYKRTSKKKLTKGGKTGYKVQQEASLEKWHGWSSVVLCECVCVGMREGGRRQIKVICKMRGEEELQGRFIKKRKKAGHRQITFV